MNPIDLILRVRSGVAQIILERERDQLAAGSAFLIDGGLVTNSHNIRRPNFDTMLIRFAHSERAQSKGTIRLARDTCENAIAAESEQNDKDFAYLKLSEPELEGRHVFNFAEPSTLSVGEQILFLGYPFRMTHLTCHLGYVSSIHEDNGVEVIQIDGSVNSGNSGGPLLDLKTGKVAGIVTRAETGLLREQFNGLIAAFRKNQQVLEAVKGGPKIRGSDPFQILQASQCGMEQFAKHLRRSANVGIGFAFSAKYVQDVIRDLADRQ